jgi:DNA-binding MarR family transcriptional regulator
LPEAAVARLAEDTVVNPLEQLLGYQLRRASSAMMGELARGLARLELRPSEASVLLLIGANPGITQSELGRVLGIKRANMAPLSAALERRDLILRTRVDGRSQGLSLTEKGEEASAGALAEMQAHDRRYFGGEAGEELRRLSAVLDLLRD